MKSSGCGAVHAHHAPCLAGGITGFRQHGFDCPAGSATIIRGQDSAVTLRPMLLILDNSVLCVWGRGLRAHTPEPFAAPPRHLAITASQYVGASPSPKVATPMMKLASTTTGFRPILSAEPARE